MPRRRRGVALSDILLIGRPFADAQCLDVRIRWRLPRGTYARAMRAAASRLERPQQVPAGEFRRVLRVERVLDKLDRLWRSWPDALRLKLVFAIEQGVRADAAARAHAHRRGQPAEALKRAARTAASARRMEKLGRQPRAQELANVATAEEAAARLYFGIMNSHAVFARIIDQVREDAEAAGLPRPPWSMIALLFQLASNGDCSYDAGFQLYIRRFGRGKMPRAITTPAGARALQAAHRIARKS